MPSPKIPGALKLLVIAGILFTTHSMQAQTEHKTRFLDPVFTEVKQDTGIVYSKGTTVSGSMQSLAMDIYQPKGDALTKRPLIIFMHGGAFIMGSRKDDYAVEFCKEFARRGYVTVSMSYRLGVSSYSPIAFGEAIYRSVQDLRSAIRFLRANATQYGIDTNAVYVGGASAGAIAALHTAYWEQSDIPVYLDTHKLGTLDATSTHMDCSASVSGVINCWGALIDTSYMRNHPVPVVNVHGEDDPIVPYKYNGMGQFGLYGSYYINQEAHNLGVPTVLKAFPNTGHGLRRSDTQKWNATLETISHFMYILVKDKYSSLDLPGSNRKVA